MKIDVEVIKGLRSVTGAGIGDCKDALEQSGGDVDKARELLREKGLAKAYKKAGRDVSEGLVAVFADKSRAAILKLGSETDFVARSEKFSAFAFGLVKCLHAHGKEDLGEFSQTTYTGTTSAVSEEIVASAAVLGENVVLGGIGIVELKGAGVIGSYVHSSISEGLGKAAAVVAIESSASHDELSVIAKQIAMHIVAAKPEAIDVDALNRDIVEREREMVTRQVSAMGKPEAVTQKIVDGRMQKFFEEMVLMEQTFVVDGSTRIKDFLAEKSRVLGCDIRIASYRAFAIGS